MRKSALSYFFAKKKRGKMDAGRVEERKKGDERKNQPRNLSEPRTEMQSNLPTLREDPLPIVIVRFEDPTEPGVATGDVVELAGL